MSSGTEDPECAREKMAEAWGSGPGLSKDLFRNTRQEQQALPASSVIPAEGCSHGLGNRVDATCAMSPFGTALGLRVSPAAAVYPRS